VSWKEFPSIARETAMYGRPLQTPTTGIGKAQGIENVQCFVLHLFAITIYFILFVNTFK
jgi:hypothetical protein